VRRWEASTCVILKIVSSSGNLECRTFSLVLEARMCVDSPLLNMEKSFYYESAPCPLCVELAMFCLIGYRRSLALFLEAVVLLIPGGCSVLPAWRSGSKPCRRSSGGVFA
jgi:hypothetical protein